MTQTTHSISSRPLAFAAVLAVLLSAAATAQAQATFPIGFAVDTYELERVPTELKFQARISQARMPVGDGQFAQLFVKLMRDGTTEVCSQTFNNVSVKDSVLNLDINDLACRDRNQQTIAVDEAIAQFANLELQVCVGAGNCLASVPLGSVPYAMKSSFAVEAHEARMAEVAAQAHYAHRVTADLDMLTSGQLGTGYFDFVTPDVGYVPGLSDIYTDYSPHFDEGFVTWAPVSAVPDARRLNVCAKDDSGNLVDLDGFVIHAATTFVNGNLDVESSSTLHGPVVANAGVTVTAGNVSVDAGNVSVPGGAVSVGPAAEVLIHQAGVDAPAGAVSADTVAASNVLQSTGHLYVGTAPASPSAGSDMHVDAPAHFTGNVSVGTEATLGQLSVDGDLLVGPGAVGANPAVQELAVTASSTFAGPASFTDVGAGVSFDGPATFGDSVSFADETATVTFHGPVSFQQPISLPGGVAVPNGSVTNASIVDGAVDSRTIADDTIVADDLAPSVRRVFESLAWQSWSGTSFAGTGPAYDIAYGNGLWVAVGPNGTIHTSTSGDNWSPVDSGAFVDLTRAAYSSAAGWMAVGSYYDPTNSTYRCETSTSGDGVYWTARAGPDGSCNDVAHDGSGRWVVVGLDGVFTSTNGTTWDSADLSNVNVGELSGITYGGGTWVAVGKDTSEDAMILTSQNGTDWSSRLGVPADSLLLRVAFDGTGRFVAVGYAGLFTSSNGVSWNRAVAGFFYTVAYGNGTWVVTSGGLGLVSDDGTSWNPTVVPAASVVSDDAGTWMGISSGMIVRRTSLAGF